MSWNDYGSEPYSHKGKVIGLAGVARSGKDTVGKFLIDEHGYERISFATPVYEGVWRLNPIITLRRGRVHEDLENGEYIRLQEIVNDIGWERAKVEYAEVREQLQKYGTDAGREIHGQDCWTNIVKNKVLTNSEQNFVITDVRFENEVQLVKKLGGVVVGIKRTGVTSVNNHISDKPLPDNLFDAIIENNGTLEDLQKKVFLLVLAT